MDRTVEGLIFPFRLAFSLFVTPSRQRSLTFLRRASSKALGSISDPLDTGQHGPGGSNRLSPHFKGWETYALKGGENLCTGLYEKGGQARREGGVSLSPTEDEQKPTIAMVVRPA